MNHQEDLKEVLRLEAEFPSPEKESRGKLWVFLLLLGLLSLIIGIAVGATSVGNLCGSVFNRDNFAAELYDTMNTYGGAEQDCKDGISARAIPTWFFIILGIALFVTSLIIRNRPKRETIVISPATAATKSAKGRMEDLQELLDSAMITQEEYDQKRKSLLDEM